MEGVLTVGRFSPDSQSVQLLGTCFHVKDGLFATAAHVTANNNVGLVICSHKTPYDSLNYQDTSDTSVVTFAATIHKVDPVRDICILQTDIMVTSKINISNTDSLSVSGELIIYGYPHCTHGRKVLTYQTAIVGAKVLINTEGIKVKNIILNIQSRPGQSGSPIYSRSNHNLVAMLIGAYVPNQGYRIGLGSSENYVDPDSLHQTTHAVSAEYLLNML